MNIKTFAALCNVSVGTVSGIINNKPGFNVDTIQLVRDKMREHHYQPNPYAQKMQKNQVKTIGIVCDVENSFFKSYILKELIRFLHHQGYNTFVHYLHQNEDYDLMNIVSDSYILMADFPKLMAQIQMYKLQAIVLDANQMQTERIYHLAFDRAHAHKKTVEYFRDKGHHTFAYIGEKSNKFQDFTAALLQHDQQLDYYVKNAQPQHATELFKSIRQSGQHVACFIPYEGDVLQFTLQCEIHGLELGIDISAITWGMRYDELLPNAHFTRVGVFSDSLGKTILEYLSKPMPKRRQTVWLSVEFHDGQSVANLNRQ